ncbi:MAG: hypothetical protein ABIO94_11940 [Opitutaceae bacterium]
MSISRCSFRSVIDEVLAFAGQAPADVDAAQTLQLGGFINTRLRDWAWIAWLWPETTLVEKRRYRLTYGSGTAYLAPTATVAQEVFFPPTGLYYQALKATTGNAPATLTAGSYVTNDAYWAVCAGTYDAPDWLDATAYAVATIVRNPDNDRYYQCHTAHTSSGTLDLTKFGILTGFDPYVSRTQVNQTEIGEFLGMYRDDPRLVKRPRRVVFSTDSLGAHPLSPYAELSVPNEVFVKFRIPCPEFRGETYDALETYVADSDVIYFEGSTTDLEGDFWLCTTNTTAGQSPETTPASWERLEFPVWLRTPVARKAFADWLRYGAQRESAQGEDAAAQDSLFQAQIQFGAMQGQNLCWRKTA